MSTTISAVLINLLATFLPLFGINLVTDDLTTTVQVIVAVATGVWIWFQRIGRGDVNALGVRK